MDRRPIEVRIDPGRDSDPGAAGPGGDAFRETLARWASTVAVVAVRDAGDVHATTVTSFFPVSAEPPLVAVSLGPNAQVLPWLEPGARFAISLLAEGQERLASTFADAYPVGPSPFLASGDPVIDGSVATLVCTVREVWATEADARLVVGRVETAAGDPDGRPLLYYRRGYRRLAGGSA